LGDGLHCQKFDYLGGIIDLPRWGVKSNRNFGKILPHALPLFAKHIGIGVNVARVGFVAFVLINFGLFAGSKTFIGFIIQPSVEKQPYDDSQEKCRTSANKDDCQGRECPTAMSIV
jgi:hypothetical protein